MGVFRSFTKKLGRRPLETLATGGTNVLVREGAKEVDRFFNPTIDTPDFMAQAKAAAEEEFASFEETVKFGAPYVGLSEKTIRERILPNLSKDSPVHQAHKRVAQRELADIASGAQLDPRVAAGAQARTRGRLDVATQGRTKKRLLDAARIGLTGDKPSSGFGLASARLAGAPSIAQSSIDAAEASQSALGSITYGLDRFAGDLSAYNQEQRFNRRLDEVFNAGRSNQYGVGTSTFRDQ